MKKRRSYLKIAILVSLTLMLTGAVQNPPSAWASMEDAAIFYEELDQHGEWVEYGNYGPVWYPSQVQENWRPYVDGRWTPAEEGYVFETQEPWGWATYHYGNWMPTEEYGWVWVPGRTWYPNTVTWRTSAESESPDESYIGWAPIPPPDYTPQPGYYPEGYYGGAPYRGPMENLVTAPFWIFVKAASFLMGFSQPYEPTYSYWGCNCLVPPPVVPYYYNRTVIVHNYYTPNYYPRGIMAAGRGYYNWGPPLPYVSRVTRIKQVNINNYMRRVHIYQRRNVAPPPGLLTRRSYFRKVVPPPLVEHHAFPRGVRVRDIQAARGNLARPHLVNANVIKGAPHVPGTIPKTRMTTGKSGPWHHGVHGAALPASAMMRPDQRMENHLRKIPSSQRIEPVSPRARKWQAPQMPGGAAGQPTAFHQRRTPETPGKAVAPSAATPRTAPPGMRQGTPGPRQTAAPVTHGTPQGMQGQRQKRSTPEGMIPKASSPVQAGVPQKGAKPGQQPQPGTWTRRKPTPQAGVTQGQSPGQVHRARHTPGSPTSPTATPVRVQTPRPSPTPPPQQQPQPQQQQQRRQQKKYTPGQPQSYGRGGPQMTGVQPRQRQIQPQPARQVRQQPTRQARPQIRQQPRPQPQRQVRQQPRPQPQRQVRQQPRPQPQRQAQQRPQAPQQKRRSQQNQQQN